MAGHGLAWSASQGQLSSKVGKPFTIEEYRRSVWVSVVSGLSEGFDDLSTGVGCPGVRFPGVRDWFCGCKGAYAVGV